MNLDLVRTFYDQSNYRYRRSLQAIMQNDGNRRAHCLQRSVVNIGHKMELAVFGRIRDQPKWWMEIRAITRKRHLTENESTACICPNAAVIKFQFQSTLDDDGLPLPDFLVKQTENNCFESFRNFRHITDGIFQAKKHCVNERHMAVAGRLREGGQIVMKGLTCASNYIRSSNNTPLRQRTDARPIFLPKKQKGRNDWKFIYFFGIRVSGKGFHDD